MEPSSEQPALEERIFPISPQQLYAEPSDSAETLSTTAEQPPILGDRTSITVKLPPNVAGEPAEDTPTPEKLPPTGAEQPLATPEPPPMSTEQRSISLPVLDEQSRPSVTYPEVTTFRRTSIPQTRSRAGSRSEPSKRRLSRLPIRPPLHIPDFERSAPQDVLDRVIAKLDSIPDDELQPIEREKLKILLKFAIHQDSLANKIDESTVDDLKLMLEQLEQGVDRFLHRGTGGSQPSSASSYVSSQDERSFQDTSTLSNAPASFQGSPQVQRSSQGRKRPVQYALKQNLLYRESQKCAISHYLDTDMLTAAHILPFSVRPLSDSCWDMLRLFLGSNLELLHQRYTGDGINCLDNAWLLSTSIDKAFTNARCYLEPAPEPESTPDNGPSTDLTGSDAVPSFAGQASYYFRWLDEPIEPQRYSISHPTRPEGYIKTGDIITLRTVDTVNYPLPNRYLLTIQAAIFKLNKEIKALADVFPDAYKSDDDESMYYVDGDDYEEEYYWDQGYEGGENYWNRVQSWLDSFPEKADRLFPASCGSVGVGFGGRFSGSVGVAAP